MIKIDGTTVEVNGYSSELMTELTYGLASIIANVVDTEDDPAINEARLLLDLVSATRELLKTEDFTEGKE